MKYLVDFVEFEYKDLGPIRSTKFVKAIIKATINAENLECLDKIVLGFDNHEIKFYFDINCLEIKFITTDLNDTLNKCIGKTIKDIEFGKEISEVDVKIKVLDDRFRGIGENESNTATKTHSNKIIYDDSSTNFIDIWCNNFYYFSNIEMKIKKLK